MGLIPSGEHLKRRVLNLTVLRSQVWGGRGGVEGKPEGLSLKTILECMSLIKRPIKKEALVERGHATVGDNEAHRERGGMLAHDQGRSSEVIPLLLKDKFAGGSRTGSQKETMVFWESNGASKERGGLGKKTRQGYSQGLTRTMEIQEETVRKEVSKTRTRKKGCFRRQRATRSY